MSFLVDIQLDADNLKAAFKHYYTYLESIRAKLPPSAYAFATAEWHYSHDHSQSLHDARLVSLSIVERVEVPPSPGDANPSGMFDIQVRLLGPHYDLFIDIRYKNVTSYRLERVSAHTVDGHSDWLIDEIRLSEQGTVLHEVVFWGGARWLIECENIWWATTPLISDGAEGDEGKK